jgi:hypothetical protein
MDSKFRSAIRHDRHASAFHRIADAETAQKVPRSQHLRARGVIDSAARERRERRGY